MAPPTHARPGVARSDPTGGSIVGSIGLVTLVAAGFVAASYPRLALAAAVGAVGTHLARRGVCALRSRRGDRRLDGFAARIAPGSHRDSRDGHTTPGRSVPDRQV